MDAKTLNALVHDREAAFYDDRFLIDYDGRIGKEVLRELGRLTGTPLRARRALDVASGTGYLAVGLAASGAAERVEACDLSAAMLERARANAAQVGVRVGLTLCDAEHLPYPDGAFDLVVARGALHHLPEPLAALREMRRVLEPEGTVLILAEPTPAGEQQVGTVVGLAYRVVEGGRRLLGRAPDAAEQERQQWELASMAANLHTFHPGDLADLAIRAGFRDVRVSTAWWAWILVMGLNYYLVGEFERIGRHPIVRGASRRLLDAAAVADRRITERLLPGGWRHTVQAVLR